MDGKSSESPARHSDLKSVGKRRPLTVINDDSENKENEDNTDQTSKLSKKLKNE